MRFIFCILCVLLRFLKPSHANCPAGYFALLNDRCLILIREHVNYCTAHRRCAQMKEVDGARSFLVGFVADLIPRNIIGTNNIWTSVNKLMSSPSDEWFVGDSSHRGNPIKSSAFIWWKGYPHPGDYRLVKVSQQGLYNVNQRDGDSMFVCELYKPTSNQSTVQGKPKQRRFTEDSDMVQFFPTAQHWGCYDLLVNQTVLSCGFKCIQRSDCRSFYHESPRGRCVLVLFVDMMLPRELDEGDQWRQFVVEDYVNGVFFLG
ncbi:hypothetical protein PHET_07469 [Paragonimus heterotremus]|uniref:C-type lectin domain-containing protein n=1 Tax=Paragonimus heterotremus TaxID=100268 RepID=A0A8J4SIJ6_9TREM|nr:hypothetical protein PHET_07469 [Paragonimus heterotremus]